MHNMTAMGRRRRGAFGAGRKIARQAWLAGTGCALVLAATGVRAQTLQDAPENLQQDSVVTNVLDICPRLAAAGGSNGTLPADEQDLFERCNGVITLANQGNLDSAAGVLGQIAAEEVLAQEAVVNGTLAPQSSALAARMSALSGRAGAGQLAARQGGQQGREPIYLASTEPVQLSQNGASLDTETGIGLFVTGDYNFGNKDATDLEAGFDFDDVSITAGGDYRLSDTVVLGAAGGYSNTEIDFDDDAGKLDGDGYNFAIYGIWNPMPQAGISAYGSFGQVDYTSRRRLQYTDPNGVVDRTAKGDTDADQYEVTGSGYYDFVAGPWTYGPTLKLSYLRTEIDGFTEQGAQGLNLTFEDQSSESVQTWLGAAVSRTFSTGFGVTVLQARAQWVHEFADDSRTVDVGYAADPFPDSPTITLTTDDPDRNRGRIGLGASFVFPGGASGFVDGETVVGHADVESYTVTAGIRFSF